jgi:hypothetical protein
VLDFGIAKLVADAAGERALETLTGQGAWLGTPAYMAPEQWSADGATAASDRYALGIVAFELLTGKPPFAATTLPGMMEQHFRASVPSVTSSGAGLHPSLDRAFARALAKDPERRPATAALVVAELEAALGGKLAARRDGPRWSRGAMLAAAAGALVLVAGAVIVVGGVGREQVERPPAASEHGANARDATSIQVTSHPAGARVRRDGVDLGVTPHLITDVPPGQTVQLVITKPGYATVKKSVTAAPGEPVHVEVPLALVEGFEGVWSLPDGGFRQFERRGDQVAGFAMVAASGERSFLRMFEFVPADDSGVVFTATEPFVDERAPDEPSCNIPLRAEYSYHPVDDSLELRKEKAQYSLDGGRCVLQATAWSEPRALERVAGATADAVWAESRAGAARPQVIDDAKDEAEQQKKKNFAQKKQKSPPPPSKNPAKQVANEPAPPPPPPQEVQQQQQKPDFKK